MKKPTKEEIALEENLNKYLVNEIKKINPEFKKVTASDYEKLCNHVQAKTPNYEKELEMTTCNITYDFLRAAFLVKNFEIDPKHFNDVISQGYLFTKDFLDKNGTNLPSDFSQYVHSVCGSIKTSFKKYNKDRKAKNADLNYKYIKRNTDDIFSDFSGIAEKSHKPVDPQNFELVK